MANAQLGSVVRYVRKLAATQQAKDETDEDLLRAFLSQNDQTAFTALVKRHGPLVMGVCRRVLHHFQDAEDAFQATFLVLARKSASLRKKNSLASWLHGVAYRMAMNAKRAAMQRRRYEGQAKPAPPATLTEDVAWREMQSILDEEIGRLPEIYRQPFILCCLENKGRAEVARQLGAKEATVWSRLARARKLLQQRLERRGVALTALLGAVALAEGTARAMVSSSLVSSTVKAALAFGAGNTPAAGVVSAQVAALVEGGLKTMFVTKAKIATALLLAAGVAAGAGLLSHQVLAGNNLSPAQQVATQRPAQDNAKAEPAKARGSSRSDAAKPEAIDKVKVRGQVLDPDGKPFAGAKLYLGGHTSLKAPTYPVRATSGDDGSFAFAFTTAELDKTDPEDPAYQILAVAKGYGCAWVTADSGSEVLTLRLVEDAPVTGLILDADGKPVAGANLTVTGVCLPKEIKPDFPEFADLIRGGSFSHAFASGWVGPLPGQPTVLTTGADGKFRLAGVGRDRAVGFRVEALGIATEAVTAQGASFEYRADVSRPIRGVVRDEATGKPLAGVTLLWEFTYNRRYVVMPWRYRMAITDKQGRYELLGVPKSSGYGAGYLAVRPALGQLYFQRTVTFKHTPGLEPMTVDIQLVQGGVTVSGKVTHKATGKPIAEALVEYYPVYPNPYNEFPILSWPRSEAITGPDGSYTLTALPGPGVISVVASKLDDQGIRKGDAYMEGHVTTNEIKAFFKTPVATYEDVNMRMLWAYGGGSFDLLPPVNQAYGGCDALVLLEPSEKDKALVKDIVLEAAQQRNGRLVGPDGQPLTGVTVWGLKSGNLKTTETTLKGPEFTVGGLNPKAPRQLAFYHKDKNLGFFLKDLPTEKDDPLIVKLQPCGSFSGRIVNQDGQPVVGVRLIVSHNGPSPYRDVTTDAQGRFRADGLVPGLGYYVRPHRGGKLLAIDEKSQTNEMVMESGKNKDLGDLKLGN